ncbi:MAG: sugar phosphate isomerase/epimerase [Nanoarchaeota archaeon]|nr:sugar phosphate isomerase/epimerase [Nanoarchaeota archaeon]MBU1855286.1 sugar phosphate isomerase/epimerase [Nanoarchaeota archaeon]
MIFTTGYYHSLDRTYRPEFDEEGIERPIELSSGDRSINTDLGPEEIGTSLNPFQHQLQALNAKIKEGASKVEFEFFGAGKGQKERATPESFDKEERQEMRNLAEINKVKSTTHATVGVQGLAGFDPKRGFEEQNRDNTIDEVEKAIDFAAEASTGGAIVVHTGEWSRPAYDFFGNEKIGGETYSFRGFINEDIKAPVMVIDKRTGDLKAMRKDTPIYEPVFKTVANYEKEKGISLVGKKDKNGNTYEAEDWIGLSGETVKKEWEYQTEKAEMIFRRVPEWKSEEMSFKTVRRDWKYFQDKAKWWNEKHPHGQLTPEEIFSKTQYINQILQHKGHSLFYALRYDREKEELDEFRKAHEFYSKLDDSLPDDEKWRLTTKKYFGYGNSSEMVPPKEIPIKEWLKNEIREKEAHLRHTHEASAAADVHATEAQEAMENVTTMHDYGLKKSSETLSELGIRTWQKYEQNKDKLQDPLYIAPESYDPLQYGSHPDELLELVQESRKKMAEKLSTSLGEERAKKLAETHIRTTLDIGHLNLWKSKLERKKDASGVPTETDEQFNKRFSKWALEKVKKLHEAKVLSHIHLTDNFGYDDEHLTVGKGNAPIKEIVEFLREKGYKDFIAEPGSFNPQTILPETWSAFGSPVYGLSSGHPQRFSQVHKQHFGYDAPPLYIVGAYSPSNEWKLWSEVPLE